MMYTATLASLRQHRLPQWYQDAKLGIFIHWGPQSVPAWAPTSGELTGVVSTRGWEYWFANNPYADWYQNSLRIPGSPTQHHHQETYGADFPYDNFIPMFQEATKSWSAEPWADLFARVGARYVVLITKHHDGFLLWDSRTPCPNRSGYQAQRDLVGELAAAVRSRGMKMGLYYSGGLDWTFNSGVIDRVSALIAAVPQDAAYGSYVDQHWRELIDRYQPSVLWNDIGYPGAADPLELLAYYYNTVPDGVVNDRFNRVQVAPAGTPGYRLTLRIVDAVTPLVMKISNRLGSLPYAGFADFRTPEYATYHRKTAVKWEATRGIGYSFCYNREETAEHMLSVEQLVRLLVDIVSKNGNLLLDVGPMADGTIPDLQRERLEGLGKWLKVNGEAIFDTRPWSRAEGQTMDGIPLRFTAKANTVYAILLDVPRSRNLRLAGMKLDPAATVHLLGQDAPLEWSDEAGILSVGIPEMVPASPAYSLKINPPPLSLKKI